MDNINCEDDIKVRFAVVEGKGTGVITFPPLTLSLHPWDDDPVVKSYNHISEVADIFDRGYKYDISCTSLCVESSPCLSENHVFVVLPLAWDSNAKTLVRYIYAIRVDGDSSIYRCQIESHLLSLDHSLPPFQSIRHVQYALNVHRSGHTHFTLPKSDEYTAGAILFLQEAFDNLDVEDQEAEKVADSRDGIMLLRNEPSGHEVLRVGSQLVAVLPPSAHSTVLEDYPSDNEESYFLHNRPLTQEITDIEGKDKQELMEKEEEPEETLAGIQVEGQPDEEPPTLVLSTGGVVSQGPPNPVLPIRQQEESVSPQTTLSTNKSSYSYVYPLPISVTDTYRQQPQSYYQPSIPPTLAGPQYSSPTMSPLAADVRNTQEHQQHYEELPMSISDYLHGTVLYARESFSKLVPSGKFAHLPKYEDIEKYDQLGKGRNGKVYKYLISNTEVALKYTKYRRSEVDICRQLSHNNIVPILSVIVVDGINERMCCQIMPCMTGSLRDELCRIGGGVLQALRSNTLSEDNLRRNLAKICSCILNALSYLSDENVEIQDLKDSNILIYKTCDCDSVYVCNCSPGYSVKLSDFDSIRMSKGRTYRECDIHKATRKSPDHCTKVLGTPGYRAPEKFLDHCKCENVAITGPWTDMWSFGVFLINQLLGVNNTDLKKSIVKEANIIAGVTSHHDVLDSHNPQPELITPYLKAIELLFNNSKLINDIVRLALKCVKADCSQRATPRQLLDDPLFAAILH